MLTFVTLTSSVMATNEMTEIENNKIKSVPVKPKLRYEEELEKMAEDERRQEQKRSMLSSEGKRQELEEMITILKMTEDERRQEQKRSMLSLEEKRQELEEMITILTNLIREEEKSRKPPLSITMEIVKKPIVCSSHIHEESSKEITTMEVFKKPIVCLLQSHSMEVRENSVSPHSALSTYSSVSVVIDPVEISEQATQIKQSLILQSGNPLSIPARQRSQLEVHRGEQVSIPGGGRTTSDFNDGTHITTSEQATQREWLLDVHTGDPLTIPGVQRLYIDQDTSPLLPNVSDVSVATEQLETRDMETDHIATQEIAVGEPLETVDMASETSPLIAHQEIQTDLPIFQTQGTQTLYSETQVLKSNPVLSQSSSSIASFLLQDSHISLMNKSDSIVVPLTDLKISKELPVPYLKTNLASIEQGEDTKKRPLFPVKINDQLKEEKQKIMRANYTLEEKQRKIEKENNLNYLRFLKTKTTAELLQSELDKRLNKAE